MNHTTLHQIIINKLYNKYISDGFVLEDYIFDELFNAKIPLYEIDMICDQLIARGVIIATSNKPSKNEDEDYDKSKVDYEEIYAEVLNIDSSLKSLVKKAREIQPPQHREWLNLFPQIKNGNEFAFNRVFEMYLRSVFKIALYYYKKTRLSLADAIQEGCIGLINAIEKYELEKSEPFPRFYTFYVYNNIQREMPFPINSTMYYPVHIKDKLLSIYDIVLEHQCEKCRENNFCPNLTNSVSVKLDCTIEQSEQYLSYFIEHLNIDDEFQNITETISDNGVIEREINYKIHNEQLNKLIINKLQNLKDKEQEIIRLRYGFMNEDIRTLEEVGLIYNVTRERIRQIEAKAIKKLKNLKSKNEVEEFLYF